LFKKGTGKIFSHSYDTSIDSSAVKIENKGDFPTKIEELDQEHESDTPSAIHLKNIELNIDRQ